MKSKIAPFALALLAASFTGAAETNPVSKPAPDLANRSAVQAELPLTAKEKAAPSTVATEPASARAMFQDAFKEMRSAKSATDRDHALAVMKQAAAAGSVDACMTLGALDPSPAGAPWSLKAAEAGRLPAVLDLARRSLSGVGVPQDRAAAYLWYRRATGLGNPAGPTTALWAKLTPQERGKASAALGQR